MAMAFALAGLRVPGVVIRDPACASKTWPGYFDSLDARTLQFALAFERLPKHVKERWEALVQMLGDDKPTP